MVLPFGLFRVKSTTLQKNLSVPDTPKCFNQYTVHITGTFVCLLQHFSMPDTLYVFVVAIRPVPDADLYRPGTDPEINKGGWLPSLAQILS